MRILMLTQYFQPEPIFKGLPLAKYFASQGHEVQVVTGFPNYPGGKIYDGYRQSLFRRETVEGIEILRLPLLPSHDKNAIRRILNYVTFAVSAATLAPWLVKRPDVIYVYNLVTLGRVARWLRLLKGARVVIDVQDLWPESIASSGMLSSSFASRILKSWCRGEYRAADRLIVLSPGFKDNLVARGVNEANVEVIYNWCDESSIRVEAVRADAPVQSRSDEFQIVFAGTMGEIQSLESVIEAARFLVAKRPNVRFTFIGAGADVPRLKQLASDLSNVCFLPPVPQSEIGPILQSADALLVHLKDDEVFRITVPSKIQAYLYAGRPILCGVAGDAAELAGQSGAAVCFQPNSSEALVSAIEELLRCTPTMREEMGRNGRDYYFRHLSFEKGADRINETLVSAFGK